MRTFFKVGAAASVLAGGVLLVGCFSAQAQTMSGKGVDTSGAGSGYGLQMQLNQVQAMQGTHDTAITTLQQDMSAYDQRLTNLENQLQDLSNKVDNLNTTITNLTNGGGTGGTGGNGANGQNGQTNNQATFCPTRSTMVSIIGETGFFVNGSAKPVTVNGAVDGSSAMATVTYTAPPNSSVTYNMTFVCQNGQMVFRRASGSYRAHNGRFGRSGSKTGISTDGINCVMKSVPGGTPGETLHVE